MPDSSQIEASFFSREAKQYVRQFLDRHIAEVFLEKELAYI